MSPQKDIFTNVIDHFGAEQEEIRSAAAFAAGNIAIGNLQQFLPAIVEMIKTDSKKRFLALHAAKEVVTHCSQGQLEGVADFLWTPLFENSQNAEEATRNVAAACLGKLATTHPSKYLPQLHVRHFPCHLSHTLTPLLCRPRSGIPVLLLALPSFLLFGIRSRMPRNPTTSF